MTPHGKRFWASTPTCNVVVQLRGKRARLALTGLQAVAYASVTAADLRLVASTCRKAADAMDAVKVVAK